MLRLGLAVLIVLPICRAPAGEPTAPGPVSLSAPDQAAAGQSVHRSDDVKSPKFILAWGHRGDKPGEFYSPICIAINKKDEVYVADLNNARVQKFTADGKYTGGFDLPLDAPPRKSCGVGGMAVNDQGQLYMSFMNQHRIGVYTQSGDLIRQWGGQRGAADGQFDQPGGIVLTASGTLYVADQCNHRIQKFTTEGRFVSKWGAHGSEPGQFGGGERAGSRFGGPHFLAQDSKGRLYTTEGVLGRVQQFSPEGKALLAWGDKGNQPGGFGALPAHANLTFGPIGVMVDKHDRVYVSSLNDRVQLFTPEGTYLFGLGGTGNEPGQFVRPHGMTVDSKGHLYVADAGNQRIQKFAIPEP